MMRLKAHISWLLLLPIMAVTSCSMMESSVEVKTTREAAAANCEQTGKCVKDPSGLVVYNPVLVTENFVVKRTDQNPTLLTKLMNLIDEPRLLLASEKLEPLIRGITIVGEFDPCDSPKAIAGANPTTGQLRSLRQGRYKACVAYVGEGLIKRAHSLAPIDIDTTPPEVSQLGVTHTTITPTTASLSWSKAGDNLTLDGNLVYSVYLSKTHNLDSLDAVFTYGNKVPGRLTGGTAYMIESLTEQTPYHAAVIVTDDAGNDSLVGRTYFTTTASDTTPPSAPSIMINAEVAYTNSTSATLILSAGDATEMYVSNTAGCATGGIWETYRTSKSWTLGQTNSIASVYAKFRDGAGNETNCVSDTIIHDNVAPLTPVISDQAKLFNASFTTSIQQNIDTDINFKEFRYTITGVAPTCSTGTSSTAQPTSVTIPASNTTLTAIACDHSGLGSPVASETYTFDGTAPNAPTVTGVTPISDAVMAQWSWSGDTSGGNGTYRYKFNNSDLSSGATQTTLTTIVTGGPLSAGTHTLYVQERDATGNWSASGSFAIEVITPPTAPTLAPPTRYLSSLGLTWAGVAGATSYNLYWSTTSGVSKSSTKIANVTSEYIHTSLTIGNTYYYRLTAVKSGIEGAFSNEVSSNPDITPGSPTNVIGTPENFRVNLTWNEPASNGGTPVTDYVIQYSSNSGGSWTTFNDGISTTTTSAVTGLTNGTAYLFRVAAKNSVGTGNYSANSSSVTPAFTCPANYVKVQANATLGTSEFCVAKYEMKNNGSDIAVSQPTGNPWVSITRDGSTGALGRCQALSANNWTYDLISNAQWQALAREIETAQNPVGTYLNWSNNSTSGSNFLNRGHSDNSPGNAIAAGADNDPCFGTGNTNCATNSHADFTQKRTHILKSGEIIWDVAGNVWEWVKDNNPAPQSPQGYISLASGWDSMDNFNFGPEGSYTTKNSGEYGGLGFAWLNNTGGPIFRGGRWGHPDTMHSGVFAVSLNAIWNNSILGFRCVLSAQNSVAGPFFNQIGGTYASAQTISITSATSGASIYYTTDGSTPTTSSTAYTSAISVNSSRTIKAIAVKSSLVDSEVTSVSYVIDTVAPVITSASVTTPSPGTTLTPSVTFTSNEAGTFQLYSVAGCGSGSISSSTSLLAASNSGTTNSLTANVATSIYVKATDFVGNSSCTQIGSYTHDNIAPMTPVIADSTKSFNAPFNTAIQQGVPVDTNFKEFRYTIDGSTPNCSTGTASIAQPTTVSISAATITLKVVSCDSAGNVSASVASATYTYDVTPPNAPTVTATTPISDTVMAQWSWSTGGAGGNGTYRYKFNNSDLSSGATQTTSTTLMTGGPLSAGTHTLYVQERDAAGNWSLSGSFAVEVVTPPAAPTLSSPTRYISSLGLSWASVAGATSYNLYWSTTAGVSTASTKIQNVTSVYTHTPLTGGTTYYYRLAGVKNGVEGSLSNEVSAAPYSYGAPTVTAIAPSSGSANGGTAVTITGTGFVSGATASIGGASATAVTFVSSTSLTATTPAGTIGAQNVIVTNPDSQTGTLSSGFTYTAPACAGDCYLEGTSPNFAQDLAIGSERIGPSGINLTLQYANGSNGFKIWKEKDGTRILNASGIAAHGWQQQLTRAGTGFAAADFTIGSNIAGRVCPTNIFLSHSNMTATNRCLYYDAGTNSETLDAAGTGGTEGSDWLQYWMSVATGRGNDSSYYEGNIAKCADKGMRLPTMYETTMNQPANWLPTGDSGVNPTWAGSINGVPSHIGNTWTASANASGINQLWIWSGTTSSWHSYQFAKALRCVIPNSIPACTGDCYQEGSSPNYAQDFAIGTERIGPSGSTLTLQYATGTSGFKIWTEKGGSRILNATGLVANGWQKQLARAGTSFSATDFTTGANIAGRVCPTHVFLNHTSMMNTNRCLYYDGGNGGKRFDDVCPGYNCTSPLVAGEAEDWLYYWNRAATGAGTVSSYFEGNIKTCADKGMRLPTMYETAMTAPTSNLPTGDGSNVTGLIWAGANGVPSFTSGTWTASAHTNFIGNFWKWTGTTGSSGPNWQTANYIRCVLP